MIKSIFQKFFYQKYLIIRAVSPPLAFRFSSQASSNLSLKSFLTIENFLKSSNIACKGCGVPFQISETSSLGYIDPSFLEKKIGNSNSIDLTNYPEITNKFRCQRCHDLSFHNKTETVISEEKDLQSLDLESFVKKIYREIRPYSLILYLIDLSNLSATMIPRIFKLQKEKKCKIWIIVNKIDVLPKDYDLKTAKHYIRTLTKQTFDDILEEDIFFVSSVAGTGFQKLISRLKPQKVKENETKDFVFKRGYVIGCTNTGKSTFINYLIKSLRPYNEKKYMNPYEKNQDENPLAVSSAPNTTLKIHEIEHLPSKYKFFDTPGIPNEITLGPLMSRLLQKNRELIVRKKIKVEKIDFSMGQTIFLGGLVRLDFPIDEKAKIPQILTHINFAYEISIHKTLMNKANEVYAKHYQGLLKPVFDENIKNVVFKKFELQLNFTSHGECEQILEIYGLGWIRFNLSYVDFRERQKNMIKIDLYIPEGVLFRQRQSMISLTPVKSNFARTKATLHKKKEREQKIKRKVLSHKNSKK